MATVEDRREGVGGLLFLPVDGGRERSEDDRRGRQLRPSRECDIARPLEQLYGDLERRLITERLGVSQRLDPGVGEDSLRDGDESHALEPIGVANRVRGVPLRLFAIRDQDGRAIDAVGVGDGGNDVEVEVVRVVESDAPISGLEDRGVDTAAFHPRQEQIVRDERIERARRGGELAAPRSKSNSTCLQGLTVVSMRKLPCG